MKNVFISLLCVLLLIGCNDNEVSNTSKHNKSVNNSDLSEVMETMKVVINDKEYVVNLENNETVKSFLKILPKEVLMNELNGNEKYVYLDSTLPTNSSNIKTIYAGDVMLYGDNCLVIFYKSFDTSYSYTKIGHIDNLPHLGNDSVKVSFEVY